MGSRVAVLMIMSFFGAGVLLCSALLDESEQGLQPPSSSSALMGVRPKQEASSALEVAAGECSAMLSHSQTWTNRIAREDVRRVKLSDRAVMDVHLSSLRLEHTQGSCKNGPSVAWFYPEESDQEGGSFVLSDHECARMLWFFENEPVECMYLSRVAAVKDITARLNLRFGPGSLENVVIGGHGSDDHACLWLSDRLDGELDIGEGNSQPRNEIMSMLKMLNQTLASGASVMLDSCYGGSNHLAKRMSTYLTNAFIFASATAQQSNNQVFKTHPRVGDGSQPRQILSCIVAGHETCRMFRRGEEKGMAAELMSDTDVIHRYFELPGTNWLPVTIKDLLPAKSVAQTKEEVLRNEDLTAHMARKLRNLEQNKYRSIINRGVGVWELLAEPHLEEYDPYLNAGRLTTEDIGQERLSEWTVDME